MTPTTRRTAAQPPADADDSTRERILATALQVFAERGFDGARTRDIADRAGVNLGLLTYYFGNKEKLWRAAVERAFAELQGDLAAVVAAHGEGDERAQLEGLARGFVRFVADKPEFMRLMNDEGKRDSPRMRWLVDRFVRPMHDGLRALIVRAQARGLLPDVAPASLHYIMLGAAGLLFSQAPECRRITGIDPTEPAFAEAHADAVIRMLTAAAAVSPSAGPSRADPRSRRAPRGS
jgi:AcrR family transcriptional regulator